MTSPNQFTISNSTLEFQNLSPMVKYFVSIFFVRIFPPSRNTRSTTLKESYMEGTMDPQMDIGRFSLDAS